MPSCYLYNLFVRTSIDPTENFADNLVNMSPAQTDEDKKEELIKLLSIHYLEEKDAQLGEITHVR